MGSEKGRRGSAEKRSAGVEPGLNVPVYDTRLAYAKPITKAK